MAVLVKSRLAAPAIRKDWSMSDDALVEQVAKAMRFDGSGLPESERDEIWNDKLKNGVKEYWRNWVRFVLREIATASVDTLPQGGDAKQAPCASKGSAVAESETPKPSRDTRKEGP
jgi:hypothetical protein